MNTNAAPLCVGALTISTTGHVEIGSQNVKLSPKQCEVMAYLAARTEQVVKKNILFRDLWGVPRPKPKVMDVTICYIRRKLHAVKPGSEEHIITVWGVGLRLSEKSKPISYGHPFKSKYGSLIGRLDNLYREKAPV